MTEKRGPVTRVGRRSRATADTAPTLFGSSANSATKERRRAGRPNLAEGFAERHFVADGRVTGVEQVLTQPEDLRVGGRQRSVARSFQRPFEAHDVGSHMGDLLAGVPQSALVPAHEVRGGDGYALEHGRPTGQRRELVAVEVVQEADLGELAR